MEKRYAIIVALLITGIIAGNYLFFYEFDIKRESVVVARVIDGDTIELDDGRKIRMLNVDTPESGEFMSDEAVGFLKNFENKTIELEVSGTDRYGRILGRMFSPSYVNLELVELGLARAFLVQEEEIKNFKKAESEARDKGLGLWEKSEYYGCLGVEINKKEEYVIIENLCGADITKWSIKDESTRKYVFKKHYEKVRLNSGSGQDSNDEVFWGRGNVWNDDKDSIFIRDDEEKLVYFNSYGY